MTTLRYTGAGPTCFLTGAVGLVEPGVDFEVPDDLAGRFLTRPDVEDPKAATNAPAKAKAKPTSNTPAAAAAD